ncbi:uncharacterized protein LOC124873764 isoform X3 [Girardinichthys multiradiatus]|uniref:uncharacterized protein LOC124873764 isoform X3 n=1 Tax=Girardinichthys multiradiatus TaxID=208333 RepID=UPI001FAE6FAD|nr:uncharacterized protein LOC124873764 isoform X3 [Girardinichthys multiradiatus]
MIHNFILNQKEISVLDQRETESPQTRGTAEEPELEQVKQEKFGSEPMKIEDHMVLKQETDTLIGTVSGSLDIKEEPEELTHVKEEEFGSEPMEIMKKEDHMVLKQESYTLIGTVSGSTDIELEELELKQMKEDAHESEYQQVVKIEVEDISLDENQDAMKQETDTLIGKYSGFYEIKEEPVELEANKLKEEEHGAGPQQTAKKEADGSSQDENQDVPRQKTDTLKLMASDVETDNQQPELNRNQIVFQNSPKAEHHQEIKTSETSGSSRVKRQQKRAQKTRGQSNNVEKGKKDKEIHKDFLRFIGWHDLQLLRSCRLLIQITIWLLVTTDNHKLMKVIYQAVSYDNILAGL